MRALDRIGTQSAQGPLVFPEAAKVARTYWQEWRDSNPQPPVLETGALAIELHSSVKRIRRTIEARRRDVMHYTYCICKGLLTWVTEVTVDLRRHLALASSATAGSVKSRLG